MKDPIETTVRRELRRLPSVDHMVTRERIEDLVSQNGHELIVLAIQETLQAARQEVLGGSPCPPAGDLEQRTVERLAAILSPSLIPVINATGVVVHTNLGRAPLSLAAQEAIAETHAYCNLEYDLKAGQRGSRYVHAEELLCRLTGAEASLVVNNDSGAVLLILSALAKGREVVISRGQLVEIGGGFRIPDVMVQSGASLQEVGTTNRTYVRDYERAIGADTAMLLHVHTSNFRLVGFCHQPPLEELAELAHKHGLIVVDDLGSGALIDTAQFGLNHETTVQESLAAGADLVCFSGDKLLGGPQAGLVIGRAPLLEILRHHPLTRALRVSKTILSGLQATLLHYLRNEAVEHIPVWAMVAASIDTLDKRAQCLSEWLQELGAPAKAVQGFSTVGGGSLPGQTLPSRLVTVSIPDPDAFAQRLRLGSPPVVGRIERDEFILDLRTVLPTEEQELQRALKAAL